MNKIYAMLVCGAVGCGGDLSGPVGSAQMAVSATDGLTAADVGSVEVLVLAGKAATCARVLQPYSPIDDPDLDIVWHGLLVIDGKAKHVGPIPAQKKLVFYVEGYSSTDGSGTRIGRGCSEQSLASGKSSGVSIKIAKDSPSSSNHDDGSESDDGGSKSKHPKGGD